MRTIFFVFLIVASISCQSDQKSNLLKKAEQTLNESPNEENAKALIKVLIDEYEKASNTKSKVAFLNEGLLVAQKYDMQSEMSSLKLGIVTEDPTSEQSGKILLEMASTLKSRGQIEVADIMFKGVATDFESLSEEALAQLTDPNINPDTLILKLGDSIFPENNPTEIDKVAGRKYVDICEAYALANPKSDKSVDYLFKGIQMARSLNTFKKAMSLSDMILKKYPTHKKAASALFVKGFIMENNYKQYDEAKKIYLDFLERYPNDDLADDVAALINNIGKSDEELFNSIQKESVQ